MVPPFKKPSCRHGISDFARRLRGEHRVALRGYWALCGGLLLVGLVMAVLYAPVDPAMGEPHRILYVHLPAAINMFVGCAIVFASSLGYLWQRSIDWDDVAAAAAEITAALGAVVIGTGMLWGWIAWGTPWAWSPRLIFSLVIWLLYLGYLIVRRLIVDEDRRALACALYAMIAFLNVPLFYVSIAVFSDVHPSDSRLDPAMRLTLAFWIVPITMVCAGVTYLRLARGSGAAARGHSAGAS